MNLYVRYSTKEITTRNGGSAPFIAFKRREGDHEVRVIFLDDNGTPMAVPPQSGKTLAMTFGLKEPGKFGEGFLVSSAVFVLEGTAYVFRPNFNMSALNTLFGEADTTPSVNCMGEVLWRFDQGETRGLPCKTQTFYVTVSNDVIRGDEGAGDEDPTPFDELVAQAEAAAATATTQAGIATTKAGEASASASQAYDHALAAGDDRVQTGLDRAAVHADKLAADAAAVATAADRVQTGLDRAAAEAAADAIPAPAADTVAVGAPGGLSWITLTFAQLWQKFLDNVALTFPWSRVSDKPTLGTAASRDVGLDAGNVVELSAAGTVTISGGGEFGAGSLVLAGYAGYFALKGADDGFTIGASNVLGVLASTPFLNVRPIGLEIGGTSDDFPEIPGVLKLWDVATQSFFTIAPSDEGTLQIGNLTLGHSQSPVYLQPPLEDGVLAITPRNNFANFTAISGGVYHAGTTLTVTDPPSGEGSNYTVVVRAGTATIGGTAYATAGTVIRRIYSSGAWESYAFFTTPSVPALLTDLAALNASNLTSGTISLARLVNTQSVGNANTTITAGTRDVLLTAALTAPRTFTWPLASAYPAGARVCFADMVPTLTATNTVTLARAGSDTINGGTSIVLNTAGASPMLISDGVSRWNLDIHGVPRGGLGVVNLASGALVVGNGTGPVTTLAPGTSGNVLTSNGTAWISSALSGGGSGNITINTAAPLTINGNATATTSNATLAILPATTTTAGAVPSLGGTGLTGAPTRRQMLNAATSQWIYRIMGTSTLNASATSGTGTGIGGANDGNVRMTSGTSAGARGAYPGTGAFGAAPWNGNYNVVDWGLTFIASGQINIDHTGTPATDTRIRAGVGKSVAALGQITTRGFMIEIQWNGTNYEVFCAVHNGTTLNIQTSGITFATRRGVLWSVEADGAGNAVWYLSVGGAGAPYNGQARTTATLSQAGAPTGTEAASRVPFYEINNGAAGGAALTVDFASMCFAFGL